MMMDPDIAGILSDQNRFETEERALSTIHSARRVWWIVANPSNWSWDRLFRERTVNYNYGRLARNYPLVQKGDLVVGYQAERERKEVCVDAAVIGADPVAIDAGGFIKQRRLERCFGKLNAGFKSSRRPNQPQRMHRQRDSRSDAIRRSPMLSHRSLRA